jgi:hypothetical protein
MLGPCVGGFSPISFQKLLGFVNLCCQVGAAAAIGMIQHHQRPVVFPDLFLRNLAFAVNATLDW